MSVSQQVYGKQIGSIQLSTYIHYIESITDNYVIPATHHNHNGVLLNAYNTNLNKSTPDDPWQSPTPD